jgi:hypothetical protein
MSASSQWNRANSHLLSIARSSLLVPSTHPLTVSSGVLPAMPWSSRSVAFAFVGRCRIRRYGLSMESDTRECATSGLTIAKASRKPHTRRQAACNAIGQAQGKGGTWSTELMSSILNDRQIERDSSLRSCLDSNQRWRSLRPRCCYRTVALSGM